MKRESGKASVEAMLERRPEGANSENLGEERCGGGDSEGPDVGTSLVCCINGCRK